MLYQLSYPGVGLIRLRKLPLISWLRAYGEEDDSLQPQNDEEISIILWIV